MQHGLTIDIQMLALLGNSELNGMVDFLSDGKAFRINPSCPNPERREKIKLNFYFHTSLRCLKRFYEGLEFFIFYFNTTFRNSRDVKD